MLFRTELPVNQSLLRLNYKSNFLTLGSCFAEEIGNLLEQGKFNVQNNPFGTTFNPLSIASIVKDICKGKSSDELPLKKDDIWVDYGYHSSLFALSKEELSQQINLTLHRANDQLKQPNSVCIITLGTAWVYRLLDQNKVVANCHKQNAALFQKELCSLENLTESLQQAFTLLFETFPHCKVILSLSPVRHIKDGLEQNQVSKSLLRVVCHELSLKYDSVFYFPAYELMLDDLRDYRFYAKDLIHPSDQAVEYIWDKFQQTFFETDATQLYRKWNQLKLNLSHTPLYAQSAAYKKFLEKTLGDLEQMSQYLDVSEEIKALNNKLKNQP